MANTVIRAEKRNRSLGQKANSGCQLAAFWVTDSTNPQGFGSVAPKSSREIIAFGGVIRNV